MRKIAFRAWNKNTKKMVDLHAITPLAVDPQVMIDGDGLYLPFLERYVLMQFTGVKGKNLVEIYEGDIFEAIDDNDHMDNWLVGFGDGCFVGIPPQRIAGNVDPGSPLIKIGSCPYCHYALTNGHRCPLYYSRERKTIEKKYIEKPCTKCHQSVEKITPYWLKEVRLMAKLSLRELAGKIRKSAPYLWDVEHGSRGCTDEILKAYEKLIPCPSAPGGRG